jgi:demethoxyubiquinone hydroxylase (CLK1/Coq7/Cat5 family)
MLPWILSKWSWKSFAIGAGAALFGGTIARPALVHAVKAGMEVSDYAAGTIQQAKTEFAKVRDDANQLRASQGEQAGYAGLMSEMQKLRDEIASLRGTMNAQKA